ncbi:MAG: response regulator transcription factor [Nocardioidaceae bacterium]
MTVGICEDDAALRSVLTRALTGQGYRVVPVATGAEAVRAFVADPPDVIVLDLGLPDADGRDVCLALQAAGVTAPVLMLTALTGLHHKISGFEAGADDYLGKPFELAELLARVRVLERRRATVDSSDPEVRLDPATHAVRLGPVEVGLTPTEFKLLARLMAAPGDVVRRQSLVAAGWPMGAQVSENTLDSYIRRLRDKVRQLGPTARRIETVRGVGYTWR